MKSIEIQTEQRCEMIDVTARVAAAVRDSGVRQGQVIVYVPHTTAGVTINENADPDVVHDMLAQLDQMAPHDQPFYRHGEGNSAAHVKASLAGSSVTVLLDDGRLVLGTWQAIYFCEFDGPRRRRLHVRAIGSGATS